MGSAVYSPSGTSGGGSGAPTDATYLTQTGNGALSAEQAMGALTTGLVKNATTTGVQSIATGGTDYTAPAGVAGGQSISGGTASAENLSLASTAHATKGNINFGSGGLYYDEANKRLFLPNNSTSLRFGSPASNTWLDTFTGGNDYRFVVNGNTVMQILPTNITLLNASNIVSTSGSRIGLGTATPSHPLHVVATNASTSGTDRNAFLDTSFAPSSGTAAFRGVELKYVVNQTGGANGSVVGLLLNATETAVGGTHSLMDLQVGGSSRVRFDNVGGIIQNATALATGDTAGFLVTRTMAGTPTGAVADGAVVVDTTASKIWARIGGTWKSVLLV